MDSRMWSFFSLVLVVILPRLTVALNNPNHVDGHGSIATGGPMAEPGQPLVTTLIRGPPVTTRALPAKTTGSTSPTPPPTNSTLATTGPHSSAIRSFTPSSTVSNSTGTVPATVSNSTETGTTTVFNSTGTVPLTDFNYTGTLPLTDFNSTGTAPLTDFNSTGTVPTTVSNSPGTVPLTAPTTWSGTPLSGISLSGSPASGTTVSGTTVSTDKSAVTSTTPPWQGTTEENNTAPAELYSTPPVGTWWDYTTRVFTRTANPPARTTVFTTTQRTPFWQTTPDFRTTTTSFPWTTQHLPFQTTRPSSVTTQPTLTTTRIPIPDKNKTTSRAPSVVTTPRSTPPLSTTKPWHWPFPTTTQSTTHKATWMTTAVHATTGDGKPTREPRTSTVRTPTLYPITTLAPPVANASYKLPTYLQLRLRTTWPRFCPGSADVQESLVEFARQVLGQSTYDQVDVPYLNVRDHCREARVNRLKRTSLMVQMTPIDFFVAINGSYFENITTKVGAELVRDLSAVQEDISYQIISAHVLVISKVATPGPPGDSGGQGAVIGSTLSVIALVFGVVLSIVGIRVHRMRRSHAGTSDRYYFDGKQLQDALSESHQMAGVSPHGRAAGGGSHPAPSYREYILASINKGMVLDDEDMVVEVDAVEALPSHTLTSNALAKFYSYREAITEEFENLPGHQFTASDTKKKIPVPLSSKPRSPGPQSPERTRVPVPLTSPTSLTSPSSPSKTSDFVLDASFIRGYDSSHCSYIGARVSGAESSTAFWRTVWEQQSRTIVCLCSPYELGKVCPQYWPTKEGGPGTQLYGNILVTLKGGASGEHYFTSTLLIRNVEKSLCRPVTHYWFTNWLDGEVPSSPQALMSMLLQVHNTHQESYGPVIVHCSDGIGRTGLVIATDINMQRLEESHTIDIPHTVSSIRQDRGQSIQNVDQYAFIYKTLYEFSKFLSSSGMKETSDTESVVLDNPDDSISDTGNEDVSSQGTNSSKASSYLGDLSSSVKRRLALKFPSLGISLPTQFSPTSSRISTGEFVVINSPNSTNLDMSVVSGLSESEKGERNSSASSQHSPFDQTSFCSHGDVFSISHNDSAKLVPKGSSRHFTVGQRPAKREPSIVIPRPVSASCRGSRAMSGVEGSTAYEDWSPQFGQPGQSNLPQSLSSPKTDLRVQEVSNGYSEQKATDDESGRFSESLASTNPFKLEESHHELQEVEPELPMAHHIRQTSYPIDMNPFGSSSPSLPRPESPFTPYPPSSTVPPSALYDTSESLSNLRPNSNPFPSEPSLSRSDNLYPKDINPFEAPSEMGDAFGQSCESGSSLNSAFVFVPHPDMSELVRQGTYPKGMNPFDENGSLRRIPLPSSNRGGGSNVLNLAPVHYKQNKSNNGQTEELASFDGQTEELASVDGQNPFNDDWMDSAEESFT